jgi:hypothetical protein
VTSTQVEGANASAAGGVILFGTGSASGNSNNTVTANVVTYAANNGGLIPANLIYSEGSSASVTNKDNAVTNNTLHAFTSTAVTTAATGNENWTISNNTIYSGSGEFDPTPRTTPLTAISFSSLGTNSITQNTVNSLNTSAAASGIVLGGPGSTTVSRNKVYGLGASGSTSTLTGIEFDGAASATAPVTTQLRRGVRMAPKPAVSSGAASVTVVNNSVTIYGSNGSQIIYGIRDAGLGSNVFNTYYNSVLVAGTGSGSASTWACVRAAGAASTHTARNNICFNNRTGGTGNHFADGDQAAGDGSFDSDYNFFAGTGSTAANFMDYGTSASGTPVSLATWQAASRDSHSGGGTASSFTLNNIFNSPDFADLHIKFLAPSSIQNAGTPVAGVTEDFDGDARNPTAPDIGADEAVYNGQLGIFPRLSTSVSEAGGTLNLTVSRIFGADGAVSVQYATSDGTATAGSDYTAQSGTFNWAHGDTSSRTISIPISEDSLYEGNETFTVSLSNPTGGATTDGFSTLVSITDNDMAPSFSIGDVSQSEGNSGATTFTFTVTKTGSTQLASSVNYQTSDVSATVADGDYNAASGTLNFAAADASKTVSVTVNGDAKYENDELFSVKLTGASGATIGDDIADGTVVNDDAAPSLSIDDVSKLEGDSGTTAFVFTITRTGQTALGSTVLVQTQDGTASDLTDYQLYSDTVTFQPSDTSKQVTVLVNGDTAVEPDETFSVKLSNPQLATVGDDTGQGTVQNDDAGTLQFSAAAYSVGEGGASVTLNVTRTGATGGAASVSYATSDGTAAASSDYTANSGTLNWSAGDSSAKTITVSVANDNVYESDETFNVTLSSPAGATLGTPSSATVTISEDDAAPSVSVGDVTVAEPASGQSYAQFPVTLSGNATALTTTVSYTTADGTAAAPGDYTSISGTLTFAPGETTKYVAVVVKSDNVSDPNETFNLNLSGPVNATVADGAGVATITAPVAPGSIIISEFRLRGPGGETDEFFELYNNSDSDITVTDASPGCVTQILLTAPFVQCGWALVDLQGGASNSPIPRFVIQPGKVIPARGHYLVTGSGYSLGALAAANQSYTPPAYSGGEADSTGFALYKTADRSQFNTLNLLDSVGFDGVATPYREGSGLLPGEGVIVGAEHSFVRNQASGRPVDTGDNRADFILVATDPSQITNGVAVLGAPAPENSSGPVSRNSGFGVSTPIGVASSLRSNTPVTNGTLGTLSLRRKFTNNTGLVLSKLRFRVANVTTYNSRQVYASQADVRLLDAQLAGLPSTMKAATVDLTPAHPLGGGLNTGLVVGGSLTLSQPLQPGQSIDVEILLGVMKSGTYTLVLLVEGAQ